VRCLRVQHPSIDSVLTVMTVDVARRYDCFINVRFLPIGGLYLYGSTCACVRVCVCLLACVVCCVNTVNIVYENSQRESWSKLQATLRSETMTVILSHISGTGCAALSLQPCQCQTQGLRCVGYTSCICLTIYLTMQHTHTTRIM